MSQFAGSLTFKGEINKPELPFFNLLNMDEKGNSRIYCIGETQLNTSKEVIEFISSKVEGVLLQFDISISTEDKIKLMTFGNNKTSILRAYELGKNNSKYILRVLDLTNFETVLNYNENNPEVACIREAEDDKNNGGRIIKVDLIK